MKTKHKVITASITFVLLGSSNLPFLMSDRIAPTVQMIYYRLLDPEAFAQTKATLQDGTRITIKLTERVSSETSTIGEVINFEVTKDVLVNGKTVIKAGTPVYGEVTGISKKGSVGHAGAISMTVNYTQAVDGQNVPLRANMNKSGEEKLGTSVALGVVLCPLFLLKKGGESEYTPGTQFEVFVNTPVEVQVQ